MPSHKGAHCTLCRALEAHRLTENGDRKTKRHTAMQVGTSHKRLLAECMVTHRQWQPQTGTAYLHTMDALRVQKNGSHKPRIAHAHWVHSSNTEASTPPAPSLQRSSSAQTHTTIPCPCAQHNSAASRPLLLRVHVDGVADAPSGQQQDARVL